MRLDMRAARRLHQELGTILDDLDHQEVEVDADGKSRHNSSTKAAVSRALLRAEDLAQAIGTEVKSEYWRFKGHDDPRWSST